MTDPELGRMWRVQAALTEACRSVSLEDIHVFEGDVIHRDFENRMIDAETARGVVAVGELLRFIVSPGNMLENPQHTLKRCWQSAVSIEPDEVEIDAKEIASRLQADIKTAPTPFLAGLRASILHRLMTDGRIPSADRLVFMAAEHTARGGNQGVELASASSADLLRKMNAAAWIFTPSTALVQDRFRSWSPGSEQGHLDLMRGLSSELNRVLGLMPLFRRWRQKARKMAMSKNGKSKLGDLVELALREPVLTCPHVREVLGVSDRTSLHLMKEAQDMNILTLITPRRSHRVWATPMMAQNLALRTVRSGPVSESDNFVKSGAVSEIGIEKKSDDNNNVSAERLEKAFAELDDAMSRADEILAKYNNPLKYG